MYTSSHVFISKYASVIEGARAETEKMQAKPAKRQCQKIHACQRDTETNLKASQVAKPRAIGAAN